MLSDTCESANAMSDGVQSHTSQRRRNDITPDVREENRRPRIAAQMEITDVDVAILAATAGEWQEMLRQISNPTPNRDGCAGGLPKQKVHRGDVIVAHVIHSFNYGKVMAGTFIRRAELDIVCDRSLLAYAEVTAAAKDQFWRSYIQEERPMTMIGVRPRCTLTVMWRPPIKSLTIRSRRISPLFRPHFQKSMPWKWKGWVLDPVPGWLNAKGKQASR